MKRTLLIIYLAIIITVINFLSCKKEYSCEGCNKSNMPPVAVTVPEQVINLPTNSVFLNGSESYDPDGKIIKWRWTKIAGPSSFQINRIDSSSTVVNMLEEGIYAFELKVTDDKGANGMDTVQITVNVATTANQPPVACAGQDQIITLPVDSVLLDGSCSSDPDNDITSYVWTKISGPSSYSFENANSVKTQVYDLVEGSFHFELKVTDEEGLFSLDTVQVLVKNQIDNSLVDIYVAGQKNYKPVYWKNGQEIILDSRSGNGFATAITVVSNDVYVAGELGDFFDHSGNIAVYWKNGQEVLLTGATGAGATSIVVNGSDVYVTGWEFQGNNKVAKYWKNSVPISLTDGSTNALATCIVIVDGNVYITGYDDKGAKYWKNGQEVLLGENAGTTSIAVTSSDVYVAGWETIGTLSVAVFWKNGQKVILTDGPEHHIATSIAVSGNDVYVAGGEGNDHYYGIAKYWKNGQEVRLTNLSNAASATSIAVLETDVYVAGHDYETGNIVAKYWKNGQPISLTESNFSWAKSIFLVPR